jgi:hypothetical protein
MQEKSTSTPSVIPAKARIQEKRQKHSNCHSREGGNPETMNAAYTSMSNNLQLFVAPKALREGISSEPLFG